MVYVVLVGGQEVTKHAWWCVGMLAGWCVREAVLEQPQRLGAIATKSTKQQQRTHKQAESDQRQHKGTNTCNKANKERRS